MTHGYEDENDYYDDNQGTPWTGSEMVEKRLQPENDASFLQLQPTNFSKLLYPPGCPVVHTDFSSAETLPVVTYGVVTSAYYNLDTTNTLYKLDCGESFYEDSLLFGHHAKVRFCPSVGAEYVAGVVQNVSCPSNDLDATTYIVQPIKSQTTGRNTIAVRRHLVRPNYITKAPSPAKISKHPSTTTPLSSSDSPTNLQEVRRVLPVEQNSSNLEKQAPRETSIIDAPLTAQRTSRKGGKRSLSPSRGSLSLDTSECSTKRNKKESSIGDSVKVLLQRHFKIPKCISYREANGTCVWEPVNIGHVSFILHSLMFYSPHRTIELFDEATLTKLQDRTGCKIKLNGRSYKKNTEVWANAFLDIEGESEAITFGVECAEEIIVNHFSDIDVRRSLMYDIAVCNDGDRKNLIRNHWIVSQRAIGASSQIRKKKVFMSVLMLPRSIDKVWKGLLVGPGGRGVKEMESDTGCDVRVFWALDKRMAMFVQGNSRQSVIECKKAMVERVQWAEKAIASKTYTQR
jgi:hypothetical protein